ncbi:hypothetical protein ACOMHN_050476 [Nucella lapillus]
MPTKTGEWTGKAEHANKDRRMDWEGRTCQQRQENGLGRQNMPTKTGEWTGKAEHANKDRRMDWEGRTCQQRQENGLGRQNMPKQRNDGRKKRAPKKRTEAKEASCRREH